MRLHGRARRVRAVGGEQQGQPVRRGAGDVLGCRHATAARAVVHHDRLVQPGREQWGDQPRQRIGGAASGEGQDKAYRARRLGSGREWREQGDVQQVAAAHR
jgi:hypothetical protein